MISEEIPIIYDDIIYSLQKGGGGSVYWTEIIKHNTDNVTHYFYDNAKNNFFFDDKLLPNSFELSSKGLIIKRYLDQRYNISRKFIFHSSFYRICRDVSAINVTTVHDFTYELYRTDVKSNLHKWQKKDAVKRSSGVICISENTKKDLLKFYPDFEGNLKVIYNGYNTEKYFLKPKIHKTRNILFVGARTDYKRFDFAVHICQELVDVKLCIIGGGPLLKDEQNLLTSKLSDRFEFLGFLSDEQLCDEYNKAFFLCYPSEYEGFGIPILEAQACGCPVVCQRKSSVPEVASEAGVYVDLSNFEESIRMIQKLYDRDFYNQKKELGLKNVGRFSWDKCAREVFSFYKEVFYKNE